MSSHTVVPQAVSVLAFAEGGSVLVSGGDDTLVNVWLLADLLDVGLDPMSAEYSRPQPLHAWWVMDRDRTLWGLLLSETTLWDPHTNVAS